jgi:hypothetical protein|tara:strand:- start:249 stop:587 length:339 start_codon:yes stop_codon:yes gene_type:complete
MKKTILSGLLITLISLFSGCSGPSPWSGVPFEEAKEWRSIGVHANAAKYLRANGFTMYDAKPWIQSGIYNPKTITEWHRAGFEPFEASQWMEKKFSLKRAIEMKRQGLTIQR